MKKIFVPLLIALVVVFGYAYFSWRERNNEIIETSLIEQRMTATGQTAVLESRGYIDVSPQLAYQMVMDNSNLMIIDVSPKYADGHLPGAANYYIGDGSLDEVISILSSQSDYLIYCHTDSASILGAQKLVDAGFENVYRLEANYAGWVEAGFKVEV